ncbi:unnamed protein product [Alopecurus aequalis]
MAPPPRCFDTIDAATNNGAVPVVVDMLQEQMSLSPKALEPDEFWRHGHQIIDFIADYYGRMGDFPVQPSDIHDLILPGLTHWQSPQHFAHFPTSSSTVGALGEALTAGSNVVVFTWAASPATTELEMVVVNWLGKAPHRPESLLFAGGGRGTLLGTSCKAMLCALIPARDQKLAEIGNLVVYCSDQTHFAFSKAARIASIQREHCREIQTGYENMFALSPTAVQAAMHADVDAGLVPLFLCATIGTTQTTAVDWIGRCEVRGGDAERKFALVCFRLRSPEKLGGEKTANELNWVLLEEVNAVSSGPYMSLANVSGMYMLRCAVGSTPTEERHVNDAWKVVQDRASSILSKMEIIYSVLG